MVSLGYLNADEVVATRDEGSVFLRVTLRDELCVLNAQLRRVLPLSRVDEYVCIQDSAGKEMAILRTLDGLDSSTRRLFDQELDRRYYTPTITAIENLTQEAGMWHFVVQTARGATDFYVRNWRDSAHEISPGRWQIVAVDGGRFDIPNLEGLDFRSRKLVAGLF